MPESFKYPQFNLFALNLTEYWATLGKAGEITDELGVEELKRVGIDAIIQQDLNCIQCTASGSGNGMREKMDPLWRIRSAQWGQSYPGSMLDVYYGRWRDEGQNEKNLDEITLQKIYKQPIIFEKDPLDSEEAPDEVVAQIAQAKPVVLEKYVEKPKDEVNLLKKIAADGGLPQPAIKANDGMLQHQLSTQLGKQIEVEDIDYKPQAEKVLQGIPNIQDTQRVIDSHTRAPNSGNPTPLTTPKGDQLKNFQIKV